MASNWSIFQNDDKEAEVERLKRAIMELELENQRLKGIKMESEWGVNPPLTRARALTPSAHLSTKNHTHSAWDTHSIQRASEIDISTFGSSCSFFELRELREMRFFIFYPPQSSFTYENPYSWDSTQKSQLNLT